MISSKVRLMGQVPTTSMTREVASMVGLRVHGTGALSYKINPFIASSN